MPTPLTGAFDGTPNTPAFNLAQLLGRQITEEIKVKLGPEDGNQREEKRFTSEVIHACLTQTNLGITNQLEVFTLRLHR